MLRYDAGGEGARAAVRAVRTPELIPVLLPLLYLLPGMLSAVSAQKLAYALPILLLELLELLVSAGALLRE